MFEKEAEEYAEINKPFLNRYDCVCVFKEGAEFGYNKAKEEMQAQIEKMKCCGNCAKRGHICVVEEMQGNLCGKNKDKWELRR